MINTIQQAVILAGGRGERLKPLTDDLPKPMAPINGLPFLDYLIESIRLAGISNILFLLGYKAEKIIERYGMGIGRMKIEYSVGDVTDQTGKRLQNAYNQLDAQFLLMYGDTYWPIEFNQMIQSYYQSSCMVSMTVFTNIRGTGEYGFENNTQVDSNGVIRLYDTNRSNPKSNGVDIGYFIVDKKAISPDVYGNLSFQGNLLPPLIESGQVRAFLTDNQYYYITSLKTLSDFQDVAIKEKFSPVKI